MSARGYILITLTAKFSTKCQVLHKTWHFFLKNWHKTSGKMSVEAILFRLLPWWFHFSSHQAFQGYCNTKISSTLLRFKALKCQKNECTVAKRYGKILNSRVGSQVWQVSHCNRPTNHQTCTCTVYKTIEVKEGATYGHIYYRKRKHWQLHRTKMIHSMYMYKIMAQNGKHKIP